MSRKYREQRLLVLSDDAQDIWIWLSKFGQNYVMCIFIHSIGENAAAVVLNGEEEEEKRRKQAERAQRARYIAKWRARDEAGEV